MVAGRGRTWQDVALTSALLSTILPTVKFPLHNHELNPVPQCFAA